jgi:hypothetical protein
MINIRNPFLLLLSFCAFVLSYSQEYKITDFRMPYTKQYGILLYGDASFIYYTAYTLDVHPYYKSFNDRMENSFSCLSQISYDSPAFGCGSINYSIYPSLYFRRYFWGSPIFISGEARGDFMGIREYEMCWLHWRTLQYGDLSLAMGIGHLRDGRYAIAAIKINAILKKEGVIGTDLNRETIDQIVKALAGGSYFIFRHERYHRYISAIIEDIITNDPSLLMPIPIFVWFEIFDVVDFGVSYYDFKNDFDRWQRFFGSRFIVKIEGSDISKNKSTYSARFPFLNDMYYRPLFDLNYEYQKPLDIRTQLSLGVDYSIDGVNATHTFGPNARLGYGISDRLLFSIGTSVNYLLYTRGSSDPDYISIPTDVSFIYYIEDHCYLSIYFEPELELIQKYLPDHGFRLETYTSCGIEFNWRVF